MKPEISPQTPILPSDWQRILGGLQFPAADLGQVLAWVELDLDQNLRFEKSLLLLMEKGLVWTNGKEVMSWPILADNTLVHGDHAGVGHLKLETPHRLENIWYFTLAVNPHVLRLQASFKKMNAAHHVHEEHVINEYDKQICPICLSPKPANTDACPTCDPEDDAPPSTWTLFKLWRFAKPYQNKLLLGFVLTLL